MSEEKYLERATDHYLDGTATKEERSLVNDWYRSFEDGDLVVAAPDKDHKDQLDQQLKEMISRSTGVPFPVPVRKYHLSKYAVAAVILCAVSVAAVVYLSRPAHRVEPLTNNELMPGGNRAVLTLADGRKISLTDAKIGEVAKEGSAVIRKVNDQGVGYSSSAKVEASAGSSVDILTTPRGGQYQLLLPDGTKVWLNSATTLSFPSSFSGDVRRVSLVGEAYFEVSANGSKPFVVTTGKQTIQVLGTHFNVNAYPDEPVIKTSLLDGAVKVVHGNQQVLLKGGQLALFDASLGTLRQAVIPDENATVAWKNGEFDFSSGDMPSMMRQIGRWYDVTIEYAKPLPGNYQLTGSCKRNMTGNQVLKVLQYTGLNFAIEGRKIIVK